MSDSVAVRISGAGKMYKLFTSRRDNFLDALGLGRLPWYPARYSEFWALRGIDLELRSGQRLGIIGRNGAGKTTLLKLITGNVAATEGAIEVNGEVQALLDAGAGFHPDFTGYENIRAALIYLGLSSGEIAAAEEEVADFTELGEFLGQPFKTYSAGMQARLAFATATVVQPEILIVDEILSAGDAYFFGKSSERMRSLVDSGASIVLVSHALDQVMMFCEEAIWLDRGSIVASGPSMEVVKAYQQYVRTLEERRLRAKNRKTLSGAYDRTELEGYGDAVVVRLTLRGERDAVCAVSTVTLWKGEEIEDRLLVGHAQDADTSQSSFVVLDGSDWSAPREDAGALCRLLAPNGATEGGAAAGGSLTFNLFSLVDQADYELELGYRSEGTGTIALEVWRNGSLHLGTELATSGEGWAVARVPLGTVVRQSGERARRRWPGEGSLTIEDVVVRWPDGEEQVLFEVGTPLQICVTFEAHADGRFELVPAVTLYRIDGILVSNHPGPEHTVAMRAGERHTFALDFGPINLGNGRYVFSVALYRRLSHVEGSEAYDLLDRSYEFEVIGNEPFSNGIFQHPSEWSLS